MHRGVEVGATSCRLLDLTVYGWQELWEDPPEGWPLAIDPSAGDQFGTDGRPPRSGPGSKRAGPMASPASALRIR
jgi:hypothetical protein